MALQTTNGGRWKNGGVRRFAVAAIATIGALASLGCAGAEGGGDCVMQAIARMGREQVSSLSAACELPADSWVVAFPANVEPHRLSGLPREFWPVVGESAKEGYNWCVSTEGQQATPAPGAMVCRQLLLNVEKAMTVRGRRFVADLRLKPDGTVVLKGLTAPTR